ncbi:DUF2284 domain-containing protein [uncultured Acetatifactor sp.]|uniref:DUF2284 domain-containing protein n=1 Tax=uncultured Acetatifactor sp. TaxID=1671927 RepID=UPI002615142B|nr:DUF2284 domain-containing protein [uncultured Acetatifactor sp.]
MVEKIANAKFFDSLVEQMVEKGAYKAAVIPVSQVELDAGFRSLCESNACGKYGKCWMCPPDIGDIDTLMKTIRTFDYAFVYQTVGLLEDSYDIEGMQEAAKKHSELSQKVTKMFTEDSFMRILHLGAGGCHVCQKCAREADGPCRYPNQALSSLEAYGINVSKLAAASGMKYINGQNTVTYFGAFFCSIM